MKLVTYEDSSYGLLLHPAKGHRDLFFHIMANGAILRAKRLEIDRFEKLVNIHGDKVESINGYPLSNLYVISSAGPKSKNI